MKAYIASSLAAMLILAGVPAVAKAQSADMSPVLVIESGPSDNADYRRMVYVKYLRGHQVSVAYKAYNRTEFIQVRNSTPADILSQCATGQGSKLEHMQAFERNERQRAKQGKAPEIARFCIKNIPGWKNGNQKRYLDPIFNGMPQAPVFKGRS